MILDADKTPPFNCFLFRALHEWMLEADLDPILMVSTPGAKAGEETPVYIGANAVRDAKFSLDGFRCLASRGGRPFTFKANWDEIRGLVVGDEATVSDLRGDTVIRWCDGHWMLNMPKLYRPKGQKVQRKIKIITKNSGDEPSGADN